MTDDAGFERKRRDALAMLKEMENAENIFREMLTGKID